MSSAVDRRGWNTNCLKILSPLMCIGNMFVASGGNTLRVEDVLKRPESRRSHHKHSLQKMSRPNILILWKNAGKHSIFSYDALLENQDRLRESPNVYCNQWLGCKRQKNKNQLACGEWEKFFVLVKRKSDWPPCKMSYNQHPPPPSSSRQQSLTLPGYFQYFGHNCVCVCVSDDPDRRFSEKNFN